MKPDNPAAWARLIFRPVWQLLTASGAVNDESPVEAGANQEKITDSRTGKWMCIPNFGHEPVEWWSCRIFSLEVTCHSLPHQPGDFAVPGFLISGLRPFFCCLLFVLVAPLHVFEGFSLAVSNLEMHALFVLGDLRARLVKLFQSHFVYVTEQTSEGIYIAEIDTAAALVVDDKAGLQLKVGDHFRAAVLPSREGGKLEIKFREIKMTVYGIGDYAYVSSPQGEGIVFKEGQTVVLVFAANEQLATGLSKTLKAVTAKAAKWPKGELTFKASKE